MDRDHRNQCVGGEQISSVTRQQQMKRVTRGQKKLHNIVGTREDELLEQPTVSGVQNHRYSLRRKRQISVSRERKNQKDNIGPERQNKQITVVRSVGKKRKHESFKGKNNVTRKETICEEQELQGNVECEGQLNSADKKKKHHNPNKGQSQQCDQVMHRKKKCKWKCKKMSKFNQNKNKVKQVHAQQEKHTAVEVHSRTICIDGQGEFNHEVVEVSTGKSGEHEISIDRQMQQNLDREISQQNSHKVEMSWDKEQEHQNFSEEGNQQSYVGEQNLTGKENQASEGTGCGGDVNKQCRYMCTNMEQAKHISDTEQVKQKDVHDQGKKSSDGKVFSILENKKHPGFQNLKRKLVQQSTGIEQMQQCVNEEQTLEGFGEGKIQQDGEVKESNSVQSLGKTQEIPDIKKCQLEQSGGKEELQKSTGEQVNQLNMNSFQSLEKDGSIALRKQSSEMNEISKSQSIEEKKVQNIEKRIVQEVTLDFKKVVQEVNVEFKGVIQETSDEFDQQTAYKKGQHHFMEWRDPHIFLNHGQRICKRQSQQSYSGQSSDSDETVLKRDWKKFERLTGAIKKGMQSNLSNQRIENCETSEQISGFRRPVADVSFRSSNIGEPVAHCSKDTTLSQPSYGMDNRDAYFQTVVILSPPYYEEVLSHFEAPQVKLLYTNSFGSKDIGYLMDKHKSELKEPILWLTIPGIYSVVECKPYTLCDSCIKPVNVMALRFKEVHKAIYVFSSSCITPKKWLKNGSIASSVPPIPAVVLMIDNYKTHGQVHMAVNENSFPVTSKMFYSKIQEFYAEFCRKWTKRACNEARSWLKENPFEVLLRMDYMDSVNLYHDNPECFTSLHSWCDLMQNFIHSALQIKHKPKENIVPMYCNSSEPHLVSNKTMDNSFERVIVVGSIDSTKTLQLMTRDLNVEYLNENVDIVKNGVGFFEKMLNTYSGKILWVVVCEINLLAENSPGGSAQCVSTKCNNRIPAIINKNNKNGSVAYGRWSVKKMIDNISNKVFNFGVLLATHYLPEDSAIFFTPIVPICAVWSCDPQLSHRDLHNLYERHPDLVHLTGRRKPWNKCVDALDKAWLRKLEYYFYNDSDVIHLLNLYRRERTPVLNLVTRHFFDGTAVEKTWSAFMVNIFRHYLGTLEMKDSFGNFAITDLYSEPTLTVNSITEQTQMVELASGQIKKENAVDSSLKITVKLEPREELVTEMESRENRVIEMEYGEEHGIKLESVEQHVVKSEPQSYLSNKLNNQPSVIQGDTQISSKQEPVIPTKTPSVIGPGIAQSSSKFQATDDRKTLTCKFEAEYKRAKKELLHDCQSELEMYIVTPEIHPEYENKYGIFKNLYSLKFPQKQNESEFKSMWKVFWKREVKQLLLKEYKMKLQALNLEHVYKLEKEAEDLLKTKPSEKPVEEQKSDKDEAQHSDKKENELPVDNILFIEEALRLLNEVCPLLGELSSPVNSLCVKIVECNYSHEMIIKIFENEENQALLKKVSHMAKELAGITKDSGSEKQVLKFQLVSVQSLKLLQWAKTCSKQEHYGLDIKNIARLTYMKDPAYIIQTIKDLLSFKNINVTKDEITDVYKLVISAHEAMSFKDFGHDRPTVSDTRHKSEQESFSTEKKICSEK